MEFTDEAKELLIETVCALKGSARRQFMARMVKIWGKGGQSLAEKELGWCRDTIRKGMKELLGGVIYEDAFNLRGQKTVEQKLPSLLEDIKDIVDSQSQTDPTFKTTHLYTRMTAAEVRKQLIKQKGYKDEELPKRRAISDKLNKLGYRLKKVQKVKPIKINRRN